MAKHKFTYNKHTLQYERYVLSLRERVLKVFKYLSASLVSAVVMLSLLYSYFPSPREKSLLNEIKTLEEDYNHKSKEVDAMNDQLAALQKRDAEVYRMIFGMDPKNDVIINEGLGSLRFTPEEMEKNLKNSRFTYQELRDKVNKLKLQLAAQSLSLDTISNLAQQKEKMLVSIPSIKPVREDKLNRSISLLSGFGWRIHPIHKIRKFHKGIDFAAPEGTQIQSTGDGVVVKVEHNPGGYGNNVTIDHGFGYSTLYAHMKVIDVKVGQKIKKGQSIGKVGDTGSSTAPHLHYEVHLRGEPVNPIQYCLDGLTPEEYQQMADQAATGNQSFD